MKIDILAIFIILQSYLGYGHTYINEKVRRTNQACIDRRPDCMRLKTIGWCGRQSQIMTKVCKKTCQACDEKCTDKRKDCPYLRKRGYCKSHPGAMEKSCPKSCGLCDKIKAAKPTEPPPTEASSYRLAGSCKDRIGKTRCQYYKYIGRCDRSNMKYYCKKSCFCDRKPSTSDCEKSRYGCCWDNKTTKISSSGRECPACEDDERFATLCGRFKTGCNGNAGLGQSLRKYCAKTCKLC